MGHHIDQSGIRRYSGIKTYNARLTGWLDRLAHCDTNMKHNAGKQLYLTDYQARNPIAKPVPIQSYDEDYVINCVIPLLEFINTHGSITDENKAMAQTDETIAQQANNQSQARSVNKQPFSENQRTKFGNLKPSKQNGC